MNEGTTLEITKFGNPVLRQKGRPVGPITPEIRQLVADMLATMHDAEGIGLAAQQVGVPLQLAIVDVSPVQDPERPSGLEVDGVPQPLEAWQPLVLIDATVEPLGKERATELEGCLSFPEITGDVTRPASVRVTTRTLDSDETRSFTATGLLARAIQHEFDHLQGILFVDRMNTATRVMLQGRLKRLKRDTETELRGT